MRKSKLYRLGALFMAALMVITCVPQTALYAAAEEANTVAEQETVAEELNGGEEFQTNEVLSSQGNAEDDAVPQVDGDGDNTKPLLGISIEGVDEPLTIERGKEVALGAKVSYNPADTTTNKALEWTSSDEGVATVNSDGLVKAIAAGETTITAKVTADPTCMATRTVIVPRILVESISLSQNTLTMTEGDDAEITVTVAPDDADNKSVEVVAGRPETTVLKAELQEDGKTIKVTARHEGKTTIYVTANDGSGKSATCEVTVKQKPNPVASFSIVPATLDLYEGRSSSLTLNYVGVDATKDVTEIGTVEWKSSDDTLLTVTQEGKVTAQNLPANSSEKTVTVTAKLTALDGKTTISASNSCTIKIKKASNPVTGISMAPDTLSLEDRKDKSKAELTIRMTPENAGDKRVKLSCTTPAGETSDVVKFLGIGAVGDDGTYTANVGNDGTCKVTVQAALLPDNQSKTCVIQAVPYSNPNDLPAATCSVTVTKYIEHVADIVLPGSLSLKEMETKTLTATITPADADDKKIVWRTSNSDQAVLLNADGEEVTVLETVAGADGKSVVSVKGISMPEDSYDTCYITATTNDGSYMRRCAVTVEEGDIPVTGITLDKESLILKPDGSTSLTATVSPEDATNPRVKWSLDKRGVVRLDEGSDSQTITVVALHAGSCFVIARAGRQTVRCEVTVKSPYLEVSPQSLRYSLADQLSTEKIREDITVSFYSLEDPDQPFEDVKDECELSLITWDEDTEMNIELRENEMGPELARSGQKKLKIVYAPDGSDGTSYTKTIDLFISENPPAELIRIGRLEKVWNVTNGTTIGKLPLPETVELYVKEDPTDVTEREKVVLAEINWDRANAAYNPSLTDREQTFTVDGVVVLPGDVRNTANVSLAVRVEVNVREKYTQRQVERPEFSVQTHQTVPVGEEIVISSKTEGASIYYTLNGTEPTRDDNLYMSPIKVTAATTVIRAIACKEGCMESDPSECTIYTSKDLVNDDDPEEKEPDEVLPEDRPVNGKVPEGLWVAIQKEEGEEDGFAYTGSAIKPEIHVYDHTRRLTEKKDYTIAYKNNVNAGDAKASAKPPTITVTGKGNYSGKADATFTIKRQSIEDESVLMDEYVAVAYNKKSQKPNPSLSWNGKKLTNKKDYTFDAVAYSEPGTYKVTVTGIGNYEGTRIMTFEIVEFGVLVTKLSFSKVPDQEYTGEAVTPPVTVTYKNNGKETVLKAGSNYTIDYVNNKNVGTASVIITGMGNYKGAKRINFKIKPAAKMSQTGITLDWSSYKNLTPVYTGEPIKPTSYTVSFQSKTGVVPLKEGKDYKVTYQNNDKAGTASIIFTGIGAYTGTVKKTFKIQAYDISQLAKSVTMEKSYAYQKNGCKPKPEIAFGDRLLKEGTDYTLTYKNASKAGNSAYVTIKGKGNFKGTFTKDFSVTMQDISKLRVVAADKPYQNKANIYKTSVKVLDVNGVALKAGTDYDKGIIYTYASGSKKGEQVMPSDIIPLGTTIQVEVRVTNPRNYKGTAYGTYRIVQADIAKAKVTVDAQEYTGLKIRPKKNAIHITMNGVPLGDQDYEIVGYENNVNQGTAKMTIRGVGNFGGTKVVNFKIQKKGILGFLSW